MDFLERAKSTIAKGVPVIRLRPRSKVAIDPDWPSLATTNLQVLEKWNSETPEANCAAVAKAQIGGTWFLEIDDASVSSRIEQETGQVLPRTYRVRSRPGRGHYYWKQTPQSIALGNLAQGFVKNGDFSVRISDQYVVAANSIHPVSGDSYEIVSDADIIEAPDWLISWLASQRIEKKKVADLDNSSPIPIHARNVTLASIAGGLRQKGLALEELRLVLGRMNNERCQPPLPENEVDTIVGSICKYPAGQEGTVLIAKPSQQIVSEAEETVSIICAPYPRFPEWVMKGTSVYEGLIQPFCSVNSRYPEFMALPAITLLLNYIGTKVRIEMKNLIPSIFMVSIGRAGRVIKSSCVQDAIRYFEYMGCVGHGGKGVSNANGKALVFTPASPEGLGKEMNRLNCKNGIMFYDELSMLTNKANIENSSLTSNLLTLYESGQFENLVKTAKDHYSLLPGTYCASLIACCTDKNFTLNWSRLAGGSTGLNDRFFFLLQPDKLKDLTEYIHVSTQEASVKTRQLIDKAIQKGVYKFANTTPINRFLKENENSNRAAIRAEKFALYFA
ncbi:MAG: bifunctional DNA primase/polymerase, partial [Thaumarchaeota archaeon]|nr:bifunctional DNA primase/polymerase [Nitrososphaerota archaeon]